jgi:hypothetical protein
MDFRLKKLKRGHGGLNMGLCPGSYKGDPMPDDAIHIHEDSFWLLEKGIGKRFARYKNYSHYGVTDFSRQEWLVVLDEWEHLRLKLERARLTTDLEELRTIPMYARKLFVRDFSRNCAGLADMIGRVSDWVRAKLSANDHLFVAGI